MYRKIIVPVDLGQIEKGEKILLKAKALLDEGGELVILNVTENVPGYLTIELPIDFAERNLAEAEARLRALADGCGVTARFVTRMGSPAREIIDAAEKLEADLVIIGSHRPNLTNYLLGSTADRVVRHAACSVLVDR